MAASTRVTIRDYKAADKAVVVPMWMNGFYEMFPTTYEFLTGGPKLFFGFSVIGAGVYALSRSIPAAAGIAGFGALLYTPIGNWLLRGVFWTSINFQAASSMKNVEVSWMEPGKSHFFVAEADGVQIGCVGIKTIHALNAEKLKSVPIQPGEASVWRLTVEPSARSLGVGRLLMAEAEKWARDNGSSHVSLICGNAGSQKFYGRLGYVPEEEGRARKVLYGDEEGKGPWPFGSMKLNMLKARLTKRKTILVKAL